MRTSWCCCSTRSRTCRSRMRTSPASSWNPGARWWLASTSGTASTAIAATASSTIWSASCSSWTSPTSTLCPRSSARASARCCARWMTRMPRPWSSCPRRSSRGSCRKRSSSSSRGVSARPGPSCATRTRVAPIRPLSSCTAIRFPASPTPTGAISKTVSARLSN